MKLIYLSPVPWSSFEQRPHKFARWFHERTGGRVLWIEPYPTRLPNVRDFSKLVGGEAPFTEPLPDWIQVAHPQSLPIEPLPGSGAVNRLFWSRVLNQAQDFALEGNVLLGVGKPSVLALQVLSLLSGVRSFYDAMDDFPAFYSGFSRFAMTRREWLVANRASQLLVSSSMLRDRWAGLGKRITLVPNGLDKNALPVVDKSRRKISSKTVFGYVGTIGAWFDWEWVDALARCRPDDEVRLIGPIAQPPPTGLPGNIVFRPPCGHREAMEAMLSFDVGLIPFKKNQLTSSVDPIKYYEYRALQLPVLSTKFGEMAVREGEPRTYITESKRDIGPLAANALSHSCEEDADLFVSRNCWESRFDESGLLTLMNS